MNLTNYMDNNFHVLYYATDDKLAKDFLITLYTTGEAYSERHNYYISKHTATDILVHPGLHSIEVKYYKKYILNFSMLLILYIYILYILYIFYNSLKIVT